MIKINKQRKQAGFKNERLIVIPPKKIRKFLSHPLLKKLYITDIGFFPRAINHYRERDKGSKQNILIYCTQGKGFIRIKNKKYEINKNSILFIPKETPHIYGTDSNNPWDIYWGHFSGDSSQYYCPDLNKDNIHISSISFNKFSVLFNLFNSIFDLLERGFVLDNIIHSSQVFSNILSTIFFLHNTKDNYPNKASRYVNKSITYMKDNIYQFITLDELAKFNNLSKSQLNKIFNQKTNHSPINFFIQLKIQRACKYLDLTKLTIREISEKMGYNDQYYFSKIFKKIMGIPPSQYRKIKKG